ncbi:unnamed protein product [Orchesella dallaii]|uniref:Uncharacterized protein n=1 Tax=Orchesella dallaii TaxID=48710 RepID=A0ABP1QJK6_9HEXA
MIGLLAKVIIASFVLAMNTGVADSGPIKISDTTQQLHPTQADGLSNTSATISIENASENVNTDTSSTTPTTTTVSTTVDLADQKSSIRTRMEEMELFVNMLTEYLTKGPNSVPDSIELRREVMAAISRALFRAEIMKCNISEYPDINK